MTRLPSDISLRPRPPLEVLASKPLRRYAVFKGETRIGMVEERRVTVRIPGYRKSIRRIVIRWLVAEPDIQPNPPQKLRHEAVMNLVTHHDRMAFAKRLTAQLVGEHRSG